MLFVFCVRWKIPATPLAVATFHAFLPSACFLFARWKISAPPGCWVFSRVPVWPLSLRLSTCYLMPVTSIALLRFFRIVFRLVSYFFSSVCVLRFVCWWEPTTLCLKGRSDGVTLNIKYDTSERFIMHLHERQHEERHIIATRCMYFSWLFLDFFRVDMTAAPPRPLQFCAPIVMGNEAKMRTCLLYTSPSPRD